MAVAAAAAAAGSTHSTTRAERLVKAWSGMCVIRLRARVMACREGRESSAATGISVRELSSSHRCLREPMPLKAPAGTSDRRLASRRLGEGEEGDRVGEDTGGEQLGWAMRLTCLSLWRVRVCVCTVCTVCVLCVCVCVCVCVLCVCCVCACVCVCMMR